LVRPEDAGFDGRTLGVPTFGADHLVEEFAAAVLHREMLIAVVQRVVPRDFADVGRRGFAARSTVT